MRNPTIIWRGDSRGYAELIDQTLLPNELKYIEVRSTEVMWDAIKRLAIRGAPAIGVAAAYGYVLGAQEFEGDDTAAFASHMVQVKEYLASSRPTAVNLFWALDRMWAKKESLNDQSVDAQIEGLFEEARTIESEDQTICAQLGRVGGALIENGDTLMTHCNAGALATAGAGTALSVMFDAKSRGIDFDVLVDETRPLLQGARLTSWELMQADIRATLICDNMAAHAMKTKGVSRIFVGADRVAANGDAANKIGTYGLAVIAKAHNVPMYVVAPQSTFDMDCPTGDHIPIEERDPSEITHPGGVQIAPDGVSTWSPAFDVTPAHLLAGIVTEKGLISPVTPENVRAVLG